MGLVGLIWCFYIFIGCFGVSSILVIFGLCFVLVLSKFWVNFSHVPGSNSLGTAVYYLM